MEFIKENIHTLKTVKILEPQKIEESFTYEQLLAKKAEQEKLKIEYSQNRDADIAEINEKLAQFDTLKISKVEMVADIEAELLTLK